MEFPFFHIKKLQAAKIQSSPRTFFSSPVVGLHSVGRFISGRFCRMCLGTGEFLRPQGAIPPGLYPLQGGWVYCLAPEAPQKGECRWSRRYFWPCRTRVGFGPATGPTLKTDLCHIRALVGRNDKYRGPRSSLGCLWPFLSSSWVAFGRPSNLWAVLPGVPRHWRFPPASGATPQAHTPFGGVGFIAWHLRRLKKGIADGAEGILALPDACGLRPCDRAHLKNGLVPYSCVGGTQR